MFLEKLFSVKSLVLLAGASFALVASPIKAQTAPTLCKENEEPVFSCQLEGKPTTSISLCASKDFSATAGYLKFRQGTPQKIEKEAPKGNQSGLNHFSYELMDKEYGGKASKDVFFYVVVEPQDNLAILASYVNNAQKTPVSYAYGAPLSDAGAVACKKTTVIDKLQDSKFNLKGLLKQVK